MIGDDRVRALLEHRRWFGGDPATAEVVETSDLTLDPLLQQVVVRSGGDLYQLIVDAEENEIDDRPDLAHALVSQMAPLERTTGVRHLGLEQSNTSFVFDERIMLKLYRKLVEGPNPDVDVPDALRQAGFDNVPDVLARWQHNGRDLASLQPFLPGANDGWSLALASLRQLFGEATQPEDAGGDFASEARRLGTITALMHAAMATAFGAEGSDLGVVAKSVARGELEARLSGLEDAGALIRVHGDLHLGQVLRTDERWYVVDFEGEPGRPEHERVARSSPLKDVAGMVRSFDYAAAVASREQDEDVRALARAWERHNRCEFLEAYWDASHAHGLVPRVHADAVTLLEAFELEKALYEVAYERAHRPAWAEIPEAAVARLRAA
jgi:maltokinase